MSASAYHRSCEELGVCQGRATCATCTHHLRHEPLELHPHRQHYIPAPAQPRHIQPPASMARWAVFAALLMGAFTVGAALAGVL